MKLIFEAEDCLVGALVGVLLVAMSGKWFSLPFAKNILIVVIPIYLIFIVLDLMHEFSDLGRHFLFIGLSILHNIFDIAICIALYSVFFGFSVPFISGYTHYLGDMTILYWLGLFEAVSHIFWLVLAPFNT
jgi:hypothetical protein